MQMLTVNTYIAGHGFVGKPQREMWRADTTNYLLECVITEGRHNQLLVGVCYNRGQSPLHSSHCNSIGLVYESASVHHYTQTHTNWAKIVPELH